MITWKEEGFLPVAKAEKEGDYICPICHKILHLEAGQTIPPVLRQAHGAPGLKRPEGQCSSGKKNDEISCTGFLSAKTLP